MAPFLPAHEEARVRAAGQGDVRAGAVGAAVAQRLLLVGGAEVIAREVGVAEGGRAGEEREVGDVGVGVGVVALGFDGLGSVWGGVLGWWGEELGVGAEKGGGTNSASERCFCTIRMVPS